MKMMISLILSIFCAGASAQNIIADTIDSESLGRKASVTQHDWKKYEYVDTCTARYAIVHDWNGRCGIYDLKKKQNITELEYRELYFSRMMTLEDDTEATVFYGKKGHKEGMVSVAPTGDAVYIMMFDEGLTYSLDSCRTIDKKITKLSRKLLEKDMTESKAFFGQVLVLESQTGNVKAWVSLEDEFHNGKVADAPLLKNTLCTDPQKALWAVMGLYDSHTAWTDSVDTKCGIDSIGNMIIRDHNWHHGGYGMVTYLEGFKKHSNIAMARAMEKGSPNSLGHDWWQVSDKPREMDALSVATMYNLIALDGKKVIIPSVNTDSITTCTPDIFPKKDFEVSHLMKEYLKATLQDGGIGSTWTTKKVDISGDYIVSRNCRPSLYDENLADLDKYYSEEGLSTYNQIIFVGYFPSDNPKYTICVSIDKEGLPAAGKLISNTVNKLAEYLIKH